MVMAYDGVGDRDKFSYENFVLEGLPFHTAVT